MQQRQEDAFYAPPASSVEPHAQPRPRAWVAALLGVFAPGSGHVYAGAPWTSLRAVGLGVLGLIGVYASLRSPWVMNGISIGVPILVAIDAALLSRRASARRPAIGVVVTAAVGFVLLTQGLRYTARAIVYDGYSLPSGGMLPSLSPGDWILVNKLSYSSRLPRRGDVVVFAYPDNPAILYTKRIIGLPGEHVRVSAGRVFVDGVELEQTPRGQFGVEGAGSRTYQRVQEALPGGRSYEILRDLPPAGARSQGAASSQSASRDSIWVVPDGGYFVLGDNRDNSRDSRFWRQPFVPLEDIEGCVESIYFSVDVDSGIPRPERVGPLEDGHACFGPSTPGPQSGP